MTLSLSYSLTTSKSIELEKVSVFDMPNLGLLVNTLPADENNPVLNKDNLTIPIEMELSQKQKFFSEFFARFLESAIYFKYFLKKDDLHRFCISEITDSENVVR